MRERQRVELNESIDTVFRFNDTHDMWGTAGELRMKKIVDVLTPGYTQLLKCGEFLPLNPVEVVTDSYARYDRHQADMYLIPYWDPNARLPVGVGRYSGAVFKTAIPGDIPPLPYPIEYPDWDDAARDLAVIAARSNALSEKWDLATFLAEFRSTVGTGATLIGEFWRRTLHVANLAVSRHRIPGRFRKKPPKTAKNDRNKGRDRPGHVDPEHSTLDALRYAQDWFFDNWMLMRYGVRPVVYDLISINHYMRRLLGEGDKPFVHGRGKQSTSVIIPSRLVSSSSMGDMATEVTEEMRVDDIYRSSAYLGLNEGWADGLQFDPLVTGWELVRGSFVMDWIVDMSSWLTALSPQLRGEFLGTSASVRRSVTYTRTHRIFSDRADVVGQPGVAIEAWTREQYIRNPYAGIPVPRVDLNLSFPKILDLLAMSRKSRSKTFQILNRR